MPPEYRPCALILPILCVHHRYAELCTLLVQIPCTSTPDAASAQAGRSARLYVAFLTLMGLHTNQLRAEPRAVGAARIHQLQETAQLVQVCVCVPCQWGCGDCWPFVGQKRGDSTIFGRVCFLASASSMCRRRSLNEVTGVGLGIYQAHDLSHGGHISSPGKSIQLGNSVPCPHTPRSLGRLSMVSCKDGCAATPVRHTHTHTHILTSYATVLTEANWPRHHGLI